LIRNLTVIVLIILMLQFLNFPFGYASSPQVIIESKSLKEALEKANDGDTIILLPGVYFEREIDVNKSVRIVGKSREETIIDGNETEQYIIKVMREGVLIENLTIRNTSREGWSKGIIIYKAANVTLRNIIVEDSIYGVEIWDSSFVTITNSRICNCTRGVYIHDESFNNRILYNMILNCAENGIHIEYCDGNIICYNNFINSSVFSLGDNTWFLQYPAGGNYWNGNIKSVDNYWGPYQNISGSDGILDEEYGNLDKYPYKGPIYNFQVTYDQKIFDIILSTNSIVKNLHFIENSTIVINLESTDGESGFCRVAIPKELMFCSNLSLWQVYYVMNGQVKEVDNLLILEDANATYLYFEYSQRANEIKIISEFPSRLVITLFFIITGALLIYFKREIKKGKILI